MRKGISGSDLEEARGKHRLLPSSRVGEWKCRMSTVGRLKWGRGLRSTSWEGSCTFIVIIAILLSLFVSDSQRAGSSFVCMYIPGLRVEKDGHGRVMGGSW